MVKNKLTFFIFKTLKKCTGIKLNTFNPCSELKPVHVCVHVGAGGLILKQHSVAAGKEHSALGEQT